MNPPQSVEWIKWCTCDQRCASNSADLAVSLIGIPIKAFESCKKEPFKALLAMLCLWCRHTLQLKWQGPHSHQYAFSQPHSAITFCMKSSNVWSHESSQVMRWHHLNFKAGNPHHALLAVLVSKRYYFVVFTPLSIHL